MKFKIAQLGSQVDFSQVLLGNFKCTPIRTMSDSPPIYIKILRVTKQIMFSYRPFISQMSFFGLSFYISDTEHHLRQTEHRSDWVVCHNKC